MTDSQVIELRRYTIAPGAREEFAHLFESWFPEAFQQLGAIVLGHFFERDRPDHFTWLRAYADMGARLAIATAFYDGPLWREHKTRLNDLVVDSDDVLLLQPLTRDRGIDALPAVDPLREKAGASGIMVAQIFASTEADEELFARYRATGVREAGVLVTLDVPNNFPRHAIRSDGPWLVWLGIARDEEMLSRLRAIDTASAELVILDPARRSRLRWINHG